MMINQILTTNTVASSFYKDETTHQAPININKPDTFESSKEKLKNKHMTFIMAGIAGASAIVFGITRHRLGKILTTAGEDLPKTATGRFNKVLGLISKDVKTGLLNHSCLMADIGNDYKKAIDSKKNFNVAMIDIDNFKSINEIFNHDTGDIVLKRISLNIREISEKYNAKSYRFGGEEFVITMSGQDSKTAKNIVEEISDTITNDKQIQDYLPAFIEKTNEKSKFVNLQLSKMNSFLPRLRKDASTNNYKNVAEEIISFLDEHLKNCDLKDATVINKIIAKLKSASAEELSDILKSTKKYDDKGTLGEELNKIYFQYKTKSANLENWISNIKDKQKFTLSAGVVSSENAKNVEDAKLFIKMADAAMNLSKENGKAKITIANSEIIKKIINEAQNNTVI